MSDDAALLELYQRAQNAFTDVVDGVEPEQWDDVVPPGRTVIGLVTHLAGEARVLPDLLAGSARARKTVDDLGDDPLGEWESAADVALAALAEPGALDGVVRLSDGETPVRDHVEALVADLVAAALDLARATGQDDRFDPVLLTFVARRV